MGKTIKIILLIILIFVVLLVGGFSYIALWLRSVSAVPL